MLFCSVALSVCRPEDLDVDDLNESVKCVLLIYFEHPGRPSGWPKAPVVKALSYFQCDTIFIL